MYLDAKHVVLYAVYAEYQTDIPHMELLSAQCLGMKEGVFHRALLKLQNEGLIEGLIIHPSHLWWSPKEIVTINVRPTKAGLDYVERYVDIAPEEDEYVKRNAIYYYAGRVKDFAFSEHKKYGEFLMIWVSGVKLGHYNLPNADTAGEPEVKG